MAAIQKAGVATNVLEILRKQIPAFGGRSSTGNSNATNNNQRTAGGSSIQLRNLDTLVLVNGRRIAPSAISGINGKIFVNVNEIPPDAIDHIEVLTDGASAIYGSEAIGGVVNIILKSNWHGGQVNARYGGAHGYNERNLGFTYGGNVLPTTNITVSASYSKSDPLFQNQRRFSSPFYSTGTAVPGAIANFFLAPGISSPTLGGGYAGPANDPQYLNAGPTVATAPGTGIGGTYDLSRFNTLLLRQEQKALTVGLNSELVADHAVDLFGDFEIARNDNFTRLIPVTLGVTVPAGAPSTRSRTPQVLRSAAPRSRHLHDAGKQLSRHPRIQGPYSCPRSWRQLGNCLYPHQNKIDQTIANIIYRNNVLPGVTGGYNSSCVATPGGTFSRVTVIGTTTLLCQPALDPFSVSTAVNPAALANVLTNELVHGKSKIDVIDGKVTGSLFHMPGGPIQFAIGAAWRREAISGGVDPVN